MFNHIFHQNIIFYKLAGINFSLEYAYLINFEVCIRLIANEIKHCNWEIIRKQISTLGSSLHRYMPHELHRKNDRGHSAIRRNSLRNA